MWGVEKVRGDTYLVSGRLAGLALLAALAAAAGLATQRQGDLFVPASLAGKKQPRGRKRQSTQSTAMV